MPLPILGPRRSAVWLTLAIATLLLELPGSTQGLLGASARTRIGGLEAAEGEVLVKYRDEHAHAAHARLAGVGRCRSGGACWPGWHQAAPVAPAGNRRSDRPATERSRRRVRRAQLRLDAHSGQPLLQVYARARSAWNTGAREKAADQAFAIMPKVTGLTLAPSLTAPQPPATTVTWTAAASGGQAPYQYQWVVYDGVTWATVTDWSTSPTFSWTPAGANSSYQGFVRARSAWNTGPREMAAGKAFAIR